MAYLMHQYIKLKFILPCFDMYLSVCHLFSTLFMLTVDKQYCQTHFTFELSLNVLIEDHLWKQNSLAPTSHCELFYVTCSLPWISNRGALKIVVGRLNILMFAWWNQGKA